MISLGNVYIYSCCGDRVVKGVMTKIWIELRRENWTSVKPLACIIVFINMCVRSQKQTQYIYIARWGRGWSLAGLTSPLLCWLKSSCDRGAGHLQIIAAMASHRGFWVRREGEEARVPHVFIMLCVLIPVVRHNAMKRCNEWRRQLRSEHRLIASESDASSDYLNFSVPRPLIDRHVPSSINTYMHKHSQTHIHII